MALALYLDDPSGGFVIVPPEGSGDPVEAARSGCARLGDPHRVPAYLTKLAGLLREVVGRSPGDAVPVITGVFVASLCALGEASDGDAEPVDTVPLHDFHRVLAETFDATASNEGVNALLRATVDLSATVHVQVGGDTDRLVTLYLAGVVISLVTMSDSAAEGTFRLTEHVGEIVDELSAVVPADHGSLVRDIVEVACLAVDAGEHLDAGHDAAALASTRAAATRCRSLGLPADAAAADAIGAAALVGLGRHDEAAELAGWARAVLGEYGMTDAVRRCEDLLAQRGS